MIQVAKKELQVLVAEQKILNRIYVIRGQKIMIDEDLAEMYNVQTRRLNEQVKRNIKRFPKDFMFTLTQKESENLKSQNATSSLPVLPTGRQAARQVGEVEGNYPKLLRSKA